MKQIKVKTKVNATAKKVWDVWNDPTHIVKWNTPTDGWHTPHAENDLRIGGHFLSRMEAKDGSFGFDFTGTYDEIVPESRIAYTMGDGRKAEIDFKENQGQTEIVTVFDPETENPMEMQKDGWQAILDSFKNYTENN